MRMLFACRPGMGHYQPLVPLARAAMASGHDVAFALADPVLEIARAAGFAVYAAGLSGPASMARIKADGVVFHALPPKEMRPYAFGTWFSRVEAPPRLADLLRICDAFRPDVLVHGVAELAAPLAATEAGLPWVTVGFGALLPPAIAGLAGEGVAPLWQARGHTPPPWGGLYRHLYVDPFPPGLQIPEIAELPRVIRVRPAAGSAAAMSCAAASRRSYVSFGTVWNSGPAAVALMRDAVAGAAAASDEVVATLGRDADPALLGPMPAHVRVHGFVPQDEILPRCSCAVVHAGSGTLLGALAWGVPLVLLPQFADQFYNAELAARAGVAVVLRPGEASREAIAAGVRRVLDAPAFAERAGAVRAELADMAGMDVVLARIETLVGDFAAR